MKNFFPILFIVLMFGLTMVVQMVISGKDLSASKLTKNSEKLVLFESNFKKLKLVTSHGTKHNLQNLKKPIVILNFWASWCQPCLSEFATLKKLVEKYPNDILVLGINNDEEKPVATIEKVEKNLSLNFESVVDSNNKITSMFEIEVIPASIAFFRGKVFQYVNKENDFMSPDFLNEIEQQLKQVSKAE